MKVVFFETKEWEREYLGERLDGFELIFAEAGSTPAEFASGHADAECLSPFIVPRLDAATRDPFLADLLGFSYASLEKVLRESDIVSLHCGLTRETEHLLGRAQFAMMKKGALVINTGRGPLVDTDALAEALESGHLGGAGLDVVEGEEFIQEERQLLQKNSDVRELRGAVRNRLLFARDNVVFTPHNAFNSQEALQRILDTTVANLEGFRTGKAPSRVV